MRVSKLLAGAALVAAMVFGTTANAAGPFDPFKSGNWKGGAYTSKKTGEFSHCAASVRYKSGIIISIHITRKAKWRMGLGHRNWKLTNRRIIRFGLSFDGLAPVNVRGLAISSKVAIIPMPNKSKVIRLFRNASSLEMFVDGHKFRFRLDGTRRLLPALARCVKRNR